jgi:hypothetical protein
MKFETIAGYTGFGLGILNSMVGGIALWRSRKEAVRTRQRGLRGELRVILREIVDACDEYENGQIEFLNEQMLREASAQVQHLRDEGLLSPGDTHLEQLQTLLREIEGRWTIPQELPQQALGAEEYQRLVQANVDRMNLAEARLHARARTYLRATTRIDNGSYATYLRFTRLGLRQSQGR